MKTIKQFIPSLFANYSDDISKITTMSSKLSTVSNTSSTFMNTLSVSKMVVNQSMASKFSCNIIDALINLMDLDYRHQGYEQQYNNRQVWTYDSDDHTNNDAGILTAKSFIEFVTSKIGYFDIGSITQGTTFDTIGYFQGIPVQCACVRTSQNVGNNFLPYNWIIAFSLGQETIISGQYGLIPFLEIDFSTIQDHPGEYALHLKTSNTESDAYDFYIADAWFDSEVHHSYCQLTIDQLASEMYNDYISNECMVNIIKRAQTDGNISRDQIESIMNQYQKTDFIEALSTIIAGTSKFSDISIITLIGKIYQNMGASYDSGDHFSIYDEPQFITSIITAVISILISAVAIIISIIWRAVGIIISMLASVFQYFIDMIQNNIAKTQAVVQNQSLTPIVNNPLLTFRLTSGGLEAWLTDKATNFSVTEIDEMLNEYGCVMVGPDYSGQCPYYFWILPRDYSDINSEYTIQLVVTAAKCNSINDLGLPVIMYEWDNNGGSVGDESLSNTLEVSWSTDPDAPLKTDRYFSGSDDITYPYLKMTDSDIRQYIFLNTIKALSDISLMNNTLMDHTFYKWGDSSIGLITYDMRPLGILGDEPTLSAMTPANIVACAQRSDEKGYWGSYAPLVKVAWITACLIIGWGHYNAEEYDWDKLDILFKYLHTIDISSNPGITYGTYRPAQLSYFNLGDGHPLATASIEWPNLSMSALVNALVLMGITTAAVAGIAVGTKVALKKFAFNRLTDRQLKFDEAKKDYEKMNKAIAANKSTMGGYTQAQIDKITANYYKTNRKLTRAWSLAGKLGLSMYNGFSTNSSSQSFSDSTGNKLSEFTTTVMNNNVGSDYSQIASDTQDYNSLQFDNQLLYQTITGNWPN